MSTEDRTTLRSKMVAVRVEILPQSETCPPFVRLQFLRFISLRLYQCVTSVRNWKKRAGYGCRISLQGKPDQNGSLRTTPLRLFSIGAWFTATHITRPVPT